MKSLLKFVFTSVAIWILLAFSFDSNLTPSQAQKVFDVLVDSVNSIKSMQFTLINHERINDKLLKGIQRVTLTTEPFRCHITMVEPGKGEELVYAGAKYKNQAVYNPVGFPYVQLELDPYGTLMRNKNHHTIFFLGFEKMMNIIQYHMKAADYTISAKELKLDGKEIVKIEIDFIGYEYVKVISQKEEKLRDLAERLALNDYMISKLNNFSLDKTIKPGLEFIVPNTYGKKIELFVDKKSGLPNTQIVYDEKGIYEKYEFIDLEINKSISMNRFDAKMLGKTL